MPAARQPAHPTRKVSLVPLLNASAVVQVHVVVAIAALFSGAAILLLPKGTPLHRALGRIGAGALVITALSSFGIYRNGLSIIHLLSLLTLYSVTRGIIAIRQGDVARHSGYMRGAWFGLVGAGVFTLLPGRVMNAVFFGL